MFRILKIKLDRHGLVHHKPMYNYSSNKLQHMPYYICHLDQYELDILMKALKAESEKQV